jgi:hypothetical protein
VESTFSIILSIRLDVFGICSAVAMLLWKTQAKNQAL